MWKTPLRFGLLLIGMAAGSLVMHAAAAQTPDAKILLRDIHLRETTDQIEFANATVRLTFDKSTGQWAGLFARGITGNIIAPAAMPSADFRVDGEAIPQEHDATLRRWNTEIDEPNQAVRLSLVFDVPSGQKQNEKPARAASFEFTSAYTLFADQGRIDRSTSVRGHDAATAHGNALHFEGFAFAIPGVAVGTPQDCVVDAPGPFRPKTYLRPKTPYVSLVESQRSLHSAPDAGFGLIAITNRDLDVTLASWMDTAGKVNYHSSLQDDGKWITLRHADERAYRFEKGMTIRSDAHRIEIIQGGLPAALARYRRMCEQRMPLDSRTPAWACEMVLLEVYPPYYSGGFKELADRLPFSRQVGCNTLYLMPHWVGGYCPIDLFEVDPRFGTAEDLKALVRAAHAMEMRVLFDMVIRGFNVKSPVPRQHPEMFVRNEDGSLALHRAWRSVTTDWAIPAYRKYMADLVLHDLRTYDIDGYRVDAASYKGPSWDPNLPYPAYRSGSAAPEPMEAMLSAMRQVKPDAVLLSEVFAGNPKHGPSPDDDPAVYSAYRKLFAIRSDCPELARGELLLDEVACDSPKVFTALRKLESALVLVAVSLSDAKEEATIQIAHPAAGSGPDGTIDLLDPISGAIVSAGTTGTQAVEVR